MFYYNFHVYDSKIHFIYAIPFIFIFWSSLLPLVALSRWVCFSPSKMASFHRHRCWLLSFGVFCFLIAHECDQHPNYFDEWSYCCHISPPWNPASGLVIYSGDDAVDVNRYCSDTAPLYPLLAAGGPLVKNWLGSIIRRRRANIARGWEHPWDLASTLLWPSTFRLLSMPQPLGDRVISPIDYSGPTQVSGMEGNSESSSVFMGWSRPPPGPGLPLRPGGGKICWRCTDGSSGYGSPVDCYFLIFLHHSSPQMSATAPSVRCFPSELLN